MTRWFCLLALLLVACSGTTGTDTELEVLEATGTPSAGPAAPTATLAAASPTPASPSPTATEPAIRSVGPRYRAPRIRIESWSSDGGWLAFWRSGANEGPARLRFVAAEGEEQCVADGITTESIWDGFITWESTTELTVQSNTGAWRGTICGDYTRIDRPSDTDRREWRSPDDRYIAKIDGQNEGQLTIATAAITDVASGELVARLPYSASIHDPNPGSLWLTDELFLVGPTLEGPRYLSATTGEAGNLITDLLGLVDDARAGDPWIVASSLTGADYHLLLEWHGGRAPLLLYHAESDTVEELPFTTMHSFTLRLDALGFSPDGEWLLVGDPIENPGDESAIGDDFWLRQVDPPGGEARPLASGVGGAPLAPGGEFIAFFDRATIWIYRFPTNELVGRWQARGRALLPIAWSPDGRRLAALGYGTTTGDDGLFIIAP